MLRVRQVKVRVDSNNIIDKICAKLKCKKNFIKSYSINKRSIDARDKRNICYVYEVLVDVLDEKSILKKNKKDVSLYEEVKYKYEVSGTKRINGRPVIVGSGPAGLFCAYFLAKEGYHPLILERGDKVEDRISKVYEFFKNNKLDTNSNVAFGEGGAGTFSDGKLNTLTHDKLGIKKEVFSIFVECGAPKEIMYDTKPHIGTDILRTVIINMRRKIEKMGGEFRYRACVTDIDINLDGVHGVIVNGKDYISSNVVVLAIGHSARDTFYMLKEKGIKMSPKPFAVGVRIEHPKEMIDKSQYGEFSSKLPPATYKLTYKTKSGRGVYSFCMCPGGFVVNASSEENMLAINGMSNYKRDSKNSNSAIVVTVGPNDYGYGVMDGVEFQRELERKAYSEGHGLIPVQLYKDFCNNKVSYKFKDIKPNTMGKYKFADINKILPDYICSSLKEGIDAFSFSIKNFNRSDALILGVESRTSSPVKIIRDSNGESIPGLYPCGEGAGYAGGITTSAIDGVKTFSNIIKKYRWYNDKEMS